MDTHQALPQPNNEIQWYKTVLYPDGVMFQIVPSIMSDYYWAFHDNPFIRFFRNVENRETARNEPTAMKTWPSPLADVKIGHVSDIGFINRRASLLYLKESDRVITKTHSHDSCTTYRLMGSSERSSAVLGSRQGQVCWQTLTGGSQGHPWWRHIRLTLLRT